MGTMEWVGVTAVMQVSHSYYTANSSFGHIFFGYWGKVCSAGYGRERYGRAGVSAVHREMGGRI